VKMSERVNSYYRRRILSLQQRDKTGLKWTSKDNQGSVSICTSPSFWAWFSFYPAILAVLIHYHTNGVNKLCGLSPWANYTDHACRLSANLVPTFADRGCCVVSTTDPYRHYRFSRRAFLPSSSLLYSWGSVDSVPDPLLLRKSDSAGNQTRDLWICSQELWSLDHRRWLHKWSMIKN
jgi:hypothetical protein